MKENEHNVRDVIPVVSSVDQPGDDESVCCPVCGTPLHLSKPHHVCESCNTPHHTDCWEYTGGCAIFGCRKGEIRKVASSHGESSLSVVNLYVMKLWGLLLKVDLALFLAGHMASLVFLLSLIFLIPTGYFSLAAFSAGGLVGLMNYALSGALTVSTMVFIGSSLLYLVLRIPCFFMMIHFWRLGYAVSGSNSEYALKVADSVEMSGFLKNLCNRFLQVSEFVLKKLLLFSVISAPLFLIFKVIPVASTPFALLPPIFIPGFLALLLYSGLPGTRAVYSERLTFISTFQNRLMATVKKG